MNKHITLGHNVLKHNMEYADKNRSRFQENNVYTLNLISSPGSGKTTFLEKTIGQLKDDLEIGVIEGDIATTIDAERIASMNVKAVQINTHGACHLDAKMVEEVLTHFSLEDTDLLVVENVGNLVCPAEFDLGEHAKIVILSTTEGSEKVQKYPNVFAQADVIILNKIDLLPYVSFELSRFRSDIQQINPDATVFEVSSINGLGMGRWTKWLTENWVEHTQIKGFDWT
ncbi:hydrogenase nickel incorporation protein HypB [Thalassobacillus hwangdonensis]|uniref:Hydrogenase nickel incorporation protein HypB n=1 Tax=Thalassobacillus hwangdonensis TaxID=546108 RepID=A0ABW3KXL6_9BACI